MKIAALRQFVFVSFTEFLVIVTKVNNCIVRSKLMWGGAINRCMATLMQSLYSSVV